MFLLRFFIIFCFFVSCREQKLPNQRKKKTPEVFTQNMQEEELFEPIEFAGTIEPVKSLGIFAPGSGVVQKVLVHLGDKVSKNQKILLVSPKNKIHYKSFYLTAPMDGYLLSLEKELGDFVNENDQVAQVAKLEKFKVCLQASLDDLSYIAVGKKLKLTLAEYTTIKKDMEGTIEEISPVADPKTGAFKVIASLDCKKGDACFDSLKVGTYVKAIFQKNLRQGIKVSLQYLKDDQQYIYVLAKDSKAIKVKVKLGVNYGDSVEIIEGVKPGDSIVTTSSESLEDGIEVKVVKRESKLIFAKKPKAATGS